MKFLSSFFFLPLILISCHEKQHEIYEPNTNIHFIIANESVIDDSLDIKIYFNDSLLVDGIFMFDGSSTDFQFIDSTIPKGDYQINVLSESKEKQREENYRFIENDYWFLIFYWNPRSPNDPDNEFHFTIHNDRIKVG